MSDKLYMVDIGFHEDTVIYELQPVEVARLTNATMAEVESKLKAMEVRHLIVEAAMPQQADRLSKYFNVIRARIPMPLKGRRK